MKKKSDVEPTRHSQPTRSLYMPTTNGHIPTAPPISHTLAGEIPRQHHPLRTNRGDGQRRSGGQRRRGQGTGVAVLLRAREGEAVEAVAGAAGRGGQCRRLRNRHGRERLPQEAQRSVGAVRRKVSWQALLPAPQGEPPAWPLL